MVSGRDRGVNRSVPFLRGAVHGVANPAEARHVPVCNVCENKILALLKNSGCYLMGTIRPRTLPFGNKKLADCAAGSSPDSKEKPLAAAVAGNESRGAGKL